GRDPAGAGRQRCRGLGLAGAPAGQSHMTPIEHFARALMWLAAIFTVVFLMTPLFVTVAVSFGSSSVFTLPPPDWSVRWYERLAHTRGPGPSLATSPRDGGFFTR